MRGEGADWRSWGGHGWGGFALPGCFRSDWIGDKDTRALFPRPWGYGPPHPGAMLPHPWGDEPPGGDAATPPSPGPRCHSGLCWGWLGAAWDASRDASPARPRASAFSREPAKPAAIPGRTGQAARGAARGRPAPGPQASRRRPRHPADVASPFVLGFRGGCKQAGRVKRPVVRPGVGAARDEAHKSASGQRMGSFVAGNGLSHAGQGDKGTRGPGRPRHPQGPAASHPRLR